MPKAKRSWREKLADSKDLPKTIVLDGRAKAKWGEGVMVIPAPRDVDALMRKVPAKKIVTTTSLRSALARNARVDSACPVTTGIFAWIAANAAREDESEGKKKITPWWRTLKAGGELNPKYPGGVSEQKRRLQAEGHRIVTRGKRQFVEDYEQVLCEL
jgi:hypothetical protein